MSWMGVNLEQELQTERRRRERKSDDETLRLFKKMLEGDDKMDERILANIFDEGMLKQYNLNLLEKERIYNLSDIKKLCINYRLRFLDASLFRNEIPYEAISEIKKIQKQQDVELSGFKILAPAPMFNLQRKDRDPLLFLNLGKDNFYLIHKWGGELNPFRKIVVFPFRSFKTILLCVAGLAALLAWSFPDSFLGGQANATIRVFCFFYLFFGFSALTVLYGFSRMKDFNSNLWNSKYTD
ncbi:hypothetical protein [Owenweeksia hongkongensis]|uniref:hypothetical protein n=1 Tax=Owenweeksia hongkongensis TaxID=253245 RepID=UPI003A8CD685